MTPTSKGKRKPTLKDVAQRAGVSPMTASRVVAGGSGVSAPMVKKVERAVRELGYSRNEAARLMRPGQRSGLLGVIITNIENPYYAQVLLGIESAAQKAGRLIITGISHNDPSLEKALISDLVARQIEGLIVVPASAEAPHLAAVASRGIPLTLASRGIHEPGVDTVLVDDVGGVRNAVLEQLRAGAHPMAFIGGPENITTAQQRFRGFALAHYEAGRPLADEMIARLPPEAEAVTAATRRLLDLPDPPKAIFTTNNRYTINVLRVLMEESGRWPDKALRPPLIGFDSFELADLMAYPLTLIEHDARALGRIAAELTLRRIDSDDRTPPMVTTLPSVGTIITQTNR